MVLIIYYTNDYIRPQNYYFIGIIPKRFLRVNYAVEISIEGRNMVVLHPFEMVKSSLAIVEILYVLSQ